MKWYFRAIYQYFNFSGRARRKEFWVFTLANLSLVWLFSILNHYFIHTQYFYTVLYIFSSLIFFPSIAVSARRLHDSGKSSRNILFIFIPFIGWIWLLILLILVGEPRTNNWGSYPKGVDTN
jgi:uncharacterized membrane protein YhaH (DUF805 family)